MVLVLAAQGDMVGAFVKFEHSNLFGKTMLKLLLGVASGLEGIHNLGIIHRDVKFENVLVKGVRADLADFGDACKLGADGGGADRSMLCLYVACWLGTSGAGGTRGTAELHNICPIAEYR